MLRQELPGLGNKKKVKIVHGVKSLLNEDKPL